MPWNPFRRSRPDQPEPDPDPSAPDQPGPTPAPTEDISARDEAHSAHEQTGGTSTPHADDVHNAGAHQTQPGLQLTREMAVRAAHDAAYLAELLGISPDDPGLPTIQEQLQQALVAGAQQPREPQTASSSVVRFTREEAERAAHDAAFLAAKLGISADDPRLPAFQAQLGQTLTNESSGSGDADGHDSQDDFVRTLLAWVNTRTFREKRRFLEAHPELLDTRSDTLLADLIAQYAGQQQEETMLREHRALLRDIRARGGTAQAIRDAYVNAHGGLVLDVPPWLEAVERENAALRQGARLDQTAATRAGLWREARDQAEREHLAPEIIAELNVRLWAALADDQGVERRRVQEEGLACLTAALRVYTLEAFPVQYASTQNNLGNTYAERIAGERRANLERAIACYREALQVYTLEAFPVQYASTQNNLGAAYQDRIAGERRANLERAIACYREALRVYTLEAFPVDYAMTQNNLGNTYQDRIAGERRANLERAIACYREALRVYTLEAFPVEHRETQLNRALAAEEADDWALAHASYAGALAAEDLLTALTGSASGLDAVLRAGGDTAARDGYALTRLDRPDEAAMAIERGRARGLAAALAIDAADPAQIADPSRRARYVAAREALQTAQAALNAPSAVRLDPAALPEEAAARRAAVEAALRAEFLARSAAYERAKQAFDQYVDEIRQAGDPAEFLAAGLDEALILRAAARGGPGHALVYLVATPRGGVAVTAFAANPALRTAARVLARDLPRLTADFTFDLIQTTLADGRVIGGFAHAQEGSGFERLIRQFPGETLRERARALRTASAAEGKSSMLALATEALLADPEAAALADLPIETLDSNEHIQDRALLRATLNHLFLRAELARCLPALADAVMRSLASWLTKQGATSVTLIPSGFLSAFPLAAVELAPGDTFGDRFPTSVAPSARVLLREEGGKTTRGRRDVPRRGVSAVGDPRPTHQELRWGEAEALTIKRLAHQLGLPAEARIQEKAKRGWFLAQLHQALVMDASCHGAFRSEDPLSSALQLAGGESGLVSLHDMMSHVADLRGLRLLILSACQTGIMDLRGSTSEMRSLAVGTLQAGALATLASSWSVDDRATYLLMVRFAQIWLPRMETMSPAEALAQAQAWLRTRTVADLRQWRATEVAPVTEEERQAAAGELAEPATPSDPEAAAAVAEAQAQLTAEAHAHTPHGSRDDAMAEDELVGEHRGGMRADRGRGDRYDAHEAEHLIRVQSGRAKDETYRPYDDPIYWAAFQVFGW